jgi:glycosyltransferase involved in cell wall biosynthesis
MSSPLKAAIIMPLGELRGGVERMLINLLRANRQGPNVDYAVAFLQDGPLVETVRDLGYTTAVFEAGRLRRPDQYLRTVVGLHRWFRTEQPDAVISWAAKGHLYAGPAAYPLGIPTTWYVHSLPDGHWMDRLVTALPAERVFCCGQSAEQAQQSIWPQRDTAVVYIAVDLEDFNPALYPSPRQARHELGLPTSGPVVGMVARLQRWKGVHVFVDAAQRVLQTHPDAHFFVVGGEHWDEPDYPAELQTQAAAAGVGDRFLLAGHQTNVPLWMQAADILVHASFDEPAGAVIIEGMSMAKPVVAARTSGPMEFVHDGENGLLVPPGDDEALARQINRLLSTPDLRRRLSVAARTDAAQFSVDRLARDLAAHILDLSPWTSASIFSAASADNEQSISPSPTC